MELGTKAEFRGKALFAYWPALPDWSKLKFYISRTTLPRGGTAHSGMGLPTPTINQENVPYTCLQANSIEAFSQLMFLLSR